ncbi:MAG: hypothetical protein JW843_08125 [Candidatus Aminicenantes bacterium]|nr:hypothetical protein [Candidatus Aminicenantes bacterium]
MDPEKEETRSSRRGPLKILSVLFIFPIVLLILILGLLFIPLPPPLPPAGSSARNLPAAVLTGFFGVCFIVWLARYSHSRVKKAARIMDAFLQKNGYRLGTAYAYARTFKGEDDGLIVEGELFPDFKLQPWRLSLSAFASPGFNAVIGNRKPVMNTPGCATFAAGGILSSAHVCCDDPGRMGDFLDDPAAVAELEKITRGHADSGTWQIIIQPDCLKLRVATYVLHRERAEEWLKAFPRLAKIYSKSS